MVEEDSEEIKIQVFSIKTEAIDLYIETTEEKSLFKGKVDEYVSSEPNFKWR